MALIDYHPKDDLSVTFTAPVASIIGIESFTGSLKDLKSVLKLVDKREPELGEPIELRLYEPPEEEDE